MAVYQVSLKFIQLISLQRFLVFLIKIIHKKEITKLNTLPFLYYRAKAVELPHFKHDQKKYEVE